MKLLGAPAVISTGSLKTVVATPRRDASNPMHQRAQITISIQSRNENTSHQAWHGGLWNQTLADTLSQMREGQFAIGITHDHLRQIHSWFHTQ